MANALFGAVSPAGRLPFTWPRHVGHVPLYYNHYRTFHGALAFLGEKPVGLINCFAGFSTFAAKPLLNIHDVVVHADVRGQGIAQSLLQWAENQARQLGCCKLTLEILSNNIPAMRSYQRAGFEPYVLDPAAGHALLMQKYLQEI